jgi:hypothetical protein
MASSTTGTRATASSGMMMNASKRPWVIASWICENCLEASNPLSNRVSSAFPSSAASSIPRVVAST